MVIATFGFSFASDDKLFSAGAFYAISYISRLIQGIADAQICVALFSITSISYLTLQMSLPSTWELCRGRLPLECFWDLASVLQCMYPCITGEHSSFMAALSFSSAWELLACCLMNLMIKMIRSPRLELKR